MRTFANAQDDSEIQRAGTKPALFYAPSVEADKFLLYSFNFWSAR